MRPNDPCYVYFLECEGGPGGRGIYIGSSGDVGERYRRHLSGNGAIYTRTHRPVGLWTILVYRNRRKATRVERALKKLPSVGKREWTYALSKLCPFCESVGMKVPLAYFNKMETPAVAEMCAAFNEMHLPLRRRTEEVLRITCPDCIRVAD